MNNFPSFFEPEFTKEDQGISTKSSLDGISKHLIIWSNNQKKIDNALQFAMNPRVMASVVKLKDIDYSLLSPNEIKVSRWQLKEKYIEKFEAILIGSANIIGDQVKQVDVEIGLKEHLSIIFPNEPESQKKYFEQFKLHVTHKNIFYEIETDLDRLFRILRDSLRKIGPQ